MTQIPFLLVGDGPTEPTGLGRIARDLAGILSSSGLPLDLVQIGGSIPPPFTGPWRHYPLDRGEDWGASCVERYYRDLFGETPGILFLIWDPGRLLDYCRIDLPVQKWCYTAIDAGNINGEITGPAGHALRQFDRVLAYGRWASERLKASLQTPISYLPHGISPAVWQTPSTEDEQAWVRSLLGPYCPPEATVVGAVMTNQWRKDLGIYFQTIAALRQRGQKVFGWLHSDVPVKAWAIQQLVDDFGLGRHVRVTLEGANLSDRQLACLYQRCAVTILPTLGEGFGYPIVESLAAGTPAIHGDCAGGAELVPKTEWRVPVRATRLEGIYALERPVFSAQDWANAVQRALDWRVSVGDDLCKAYCQGAVAHLDWQQLAGRWVSWVRAGLQQ